MIIRHPNIEECLMTELRSWLCCALADVEALPTESSLFTADRVHVADAVAHARRNIDAVRLYVSECREVASTHALSSSTLAFADLAEAMCHLLDEGVNVVQDHYMTLAR